MLWVLIRSALSFFSENICCGHSLEMPLIVPNILLSTEKF